MQTCEFNINMFELKLLMNTLSVPQMIANISVHIRREEKRLIGLRQQGAVKYKMSPAGENLSKKRKVSSFITSFIYIGFIFQISTPRVLCWSWNTPYSPQLHSLS